MLGATQALITAVTLHGTQEKGRVASMACSFVVIHELKQSRFIVQSHPFTYQLIPAGLLILYHGSKVHMASLGYTLMQRICLISHTAYQLIMAEDELTLTVGVMSDTQSPMWNLTKLKLP